MTSNKDRLTTPALIVRFQRQWFADLVPADGLVVRLPVSDLDAWNFDIEHGLAVQVRREPNGCRIVSRRGNKKFVQISPAA